MKCPEIDVLQAYMDGELEIGIKKGIETHLGECESCKNRMAVLKENDDFAFAKIKDYRQHFENCSVPSRLQTGLRTHKAAVDNRRVHGCKPKYRRYVAAACAILLLITGLTIEPVGAAISNILSILRVDNVEGITVTLDDMREIQKQLESGQGEISLKKMGSIKVQGGKKRAISKEDAEKLTDIDVAFPTLPSGVIQNINVVDSGTMSFTLDVGNTNRIMKSYGAVKLLPDDIDGKTFKVEFASQVTMSYSINGKQIMILQTKSPELIVPEDVNIEEIYYAVVDMPIIPKRLKSQLKSIKDWKNTLYIPVEESEMEGVDINGAKGYLTKDYGDSEDDYESAVIWYDRGIIYAVSGRTDTGEILEIARSMR